MTPQRHRSAEHPRGVAEDGPSAPLQWGRDRRALPALTTVPRVSDARAATGRALVVVTVLAWGVYLLRWVGQQFIVAGPHTARGRVEACVYLVTVTFLTASALAYLTSRLGFFYRARAHRRLPRAELDDFFCRETAPSVTVAVPSYREDLRTIRATLLSAALQDYPDLRVTLLIDDPVRPSTRRDRTLLRDATGVAAELQELLDGPADRFAAALARFCAVPALVPVDRLDMLHAGEQYDLAVEWLTGLASDTEVVDHSDAFFVDQVLLRLASDMAATAGALRGALADGVVLSRQRLLQLHQRLARTFRAEVTSFQRKRYDSLSHEANKAMNLNSYIGLMGGAYRDVLTVSGRELQPCDEAEADLVVPDPDYVLTLDADSVLLPEYCLRLVHLMEQSEHAGVAVAQTPYSAFPGSGTRLERIAGATTDLQYIAHQGMTYYGATFWVGANAVLRKRALDEVRTSTHVGRWAIHRYIQDRTVIEDTESTIDLRAAGWTLLNVVERLAYSATPPDFGSLCIQRRRWANGGVLILPKLWRTGRSRRRQGQTNRISEAFLRVNYMGSVAWSSISLLLLLAYPFSKELISPLLGLIALPYFAGMASDLKYCGYKRTDVLRIYGFNLILVPVNLAGFLGSLVQALTGEKSVFGRTPKVRDRTVPAFLFVVSPYLLTALAAWTLWQDQVHGRWINLAYAAVNTTLALYAIVAFVGLRNSVVDLFSHCRGWLSVPVPEPSPRATRALTVPPVDAGWASVLHFGGAGQTGSPSAAALLAVGDPRRSAERPAFHTVFQPIVDLRTGRVLGREALTRFEDGSAPQEELAHAAATGTGLELEVLLAQSGLAAASDLPSEEWLGLNVSLSLLRAGAVPALLARSTRRVVLELDVLGAATPEARRLMDDLPSGAALALTGTAPSYEGLRLVRELAPAFVKLDREWVREVHADATRLALLAALVSVVEEVGATLIAEGIETMQELTALQLLGIHHGQGFLLGRPHQGSRVATVA